MPAHEHLQNQFTDAKSSVVSQRRQKLLADSQKIIEDIDYAVDKKPYPKNEALEASDLKRWGPDTDPVDPDNPTIFRFSSGFDPTINGAFYRSDAEDGSGPAEYTLPNSDRQDRAEVFGSTNFHQYRLNELDRDEDGPLHGLAQPTYPDSEYEYERVSNEKKSHLYMSKQEKADVRLASQEKVNWHIARQMENQEHARRAYPDGNDGRD